MAPAPRHGDAVRGLIAIAGRCQPGQERSERAFLKRTALVGLLESVVLIEQVLVLGVGKRRLRGVLVRLPEGVQRGAAKAVAVSPGGEQGQRRRLELDRKPLDDRARGRLAGGQRGPVGLVKTVRGGKSLRLGLAPVVIRPDVGDPLIRLDAARFEPRLDPGELVDGDAGHHGISLDVREAIQRIHQSGDLLVPTLRAHAVEVDHGRVLLFFWPFLRRDVRRQVGDGDSRGLCSGFLARAPGLRGFGHGCTGLGFRVRGFGLWHSEIRTPHPLTMSFVSQPFRIRRPRRLSYQ